MDLVVDFYDYVLTTQGQTATLYAAIIGIIGVIFCFFGFKFTKVCFAFVGGTVGFFVFRSVATAFTDHPSADILCGIVGGLLLGFLLFRIYKLGVFVSGAILAAALALGITGGEDTTSYIIAGVAGLAAGIISLLWIRPSIVISTSLLGGVLVSSAIPLIIDSISKTILLIIALGLAVLGIFFQWKDTKDEFKKKKKKNTNNNNADNTTANPSQVTQPIQQPVQTEPVQPTQETATSEPTNIDGSNN